jgi:hypothetical protein
MEFGIREKALRNLLSAAQIAKMLSKEIMLFMSLCLEKI